MSTGKLEVTTPSDREITMTRAFDAPREMVFDAWTRPEILKRWMGVQNGWVLAECEVDLRVGGASRFVWRGPRGQHMGMTTVYREIVRPERIVGTEHFDDAWYPGEAVGTVVLTEEDGRTTVTQTVLYASKEARDGVLRTPMEHGMARSFDLLEELLPSLATAQVQ